MKLTWFLFTLCFAFISTQALSKQRNFNGEEFEDGIEVEKTEKTSAFSPSTTYLLGIVPSLAKFQKVELVHYFQYFFVPVAFLCSEVLFLHSDLPPPSLS